MNGRTATEGLSGRASAGLSEAGATPGAARPAGLFSSRTVPTKRTPLRGSVLIRCCFSPLSPIVTRAALMQLVSAEFGDHPPHPDFGNQVVLANDALTAVDQVREKVEDFGLDRQQLHHRDATRVGRYRARIRQRNRAFAVPASRPPLYDAGKSKTRPPQGKATTTPSCSQSGCFGVLACWAQVKWPRCGRFAGEIYATPIES